ncbi:FAD-dependent oxidoreductase, partial [Nonomuraea sp. NPDC049784]
MSQHHVIVVGGGIAGASTAFALARRGAAVTVV